MPLVRRHFNLPGGRALRRPPLSTLELGSRFLQVAKALKRNNADVEKYTVSVDGPPDHRRAWIAPKLQGALPLSLPMESHVFIFSLQ